MTMMACGCRGSGCCGKNGSKSRPVKVIRLVVVIGMRLNYLIKLPAKRQRGGKLLDYLQSAPALSVTEARVGRKSSGSFDSHKIQRLF
jgi:hypothetical protein